MSASRSPDVNAEEFASKIDPDSESDDASRSRLHGKTTVSGRFEKRRFVPIVRVSLPAHGALSRESRNAVSRFIRATRPESRHFWSASPFRESGGSTNGLLT